MLRLLSTTSPLLNLNYSTCGRVDGLGTKLPRVGFFDIL